MYLSTLASTVLLVTTYLTTFASAAAISSTQKTLTSSRPPSIELVSVYLHTKDVTEAARLNLLKSGQIHLQFPEILSLLGANPFTQYQSSEVAFLYTLSNDTSTLYQFSWIWDEETHFPQNVTLSADEWTATWTGNGSSLIETRTYAPFRAAVMEPPARSPVRIVGVNYGGRNPITSQSVFNKFYKYAVSGREFTFDADLFGYTNRDLTPKAGVVWYTEGGILKALAGGQGSSHRF